MACACCAGCLQPPCGSRSQPAAACAYSRDGGDVGGSRRGRIGNAGSRDLSLRPGGLPTTHASRTSPVGPRPPPRRHAAVTAARAARAARRGGSGHLGDDGIAEHEARVGLGDSDEALEHADRGAGQAPVHGLPGRSPRLARRGEGGAGVGDVDLRRRIAAAHADTVGEGGGQQRGEEGLGERDRRVSRIQIEIRRDTWPDPAQPRSSASAYLKPGQPCRPGLPRRAGQPCRPG